MQKIDDEDENPEIETFARDIAIPGVTDWLAN